MNDIARCNGDNCKLRDNCYRYTLEYRKNPLDDVLHWYIIPEDCVSNNNNCFLLE